MRKLLYEVVLRSFDQGIVAYRGMETWHPFAYFVIKKELFAPTLNGISVSSLYVSSMPVIPCPGLNDQPRYVRTNKTTINEKNSKKVMLLPK